MTEPSDFSAMFVPFLRKRERFSFMQTSYRRWLLWCCSSFIFLAILCSGASDSWASHFRGGTLSYKWISGRTVEFSLETYWRIGSLGSVCSSGAQAGTCVGKSYGNFSVSTGAGTASIPQKVNFNDTGSFSMIGKARYTYPRDGTFTARYTGCCWISGASGPSGSSWNLSVQVVLPKINNSPVFNSPTFFQACSGKPFSTNVNVSDPDRDSFTLKLTHKQDPNINLNTSTGQVTWTPPRAGNFVFTVVATDSKGSVAYRDFMVNVLSTCNNKNPTLTLSPSSITVAAGGKACTKVTASDPDTANKLFFTIAPTKVPVTLSPTNALTANRPNPYSFTYCWTPAKADEGTTHNILFRVIDNGLPLLDAQSTFKVTVSAGSPPTITVNPTALSVDEGKTLVFTATAADPDNNGIASFSLSGLPSFCTSKKDSATKYTITCKPGFADGTKTYSTLKFTAVDKDGKPKTTTKTVSFSVKDVNRNPAVTSPGKITLLEDKAGTFKVVASDPDGDAISYTLSGLPSGAKIDSKTGVVTWTPTQADVKTHTATVTVKDSRGGSATTQFQVVVVNVNDKPGIVGSPGTTATQGKAYGYSPTGKDEDPNDAGKLNWKLKKGPTGAKVDPKTGKITWTPGPADADKTFDFELELCDPQGGCASQSWKVKVANVNDPPSFTSQPGTTATEDKPYTYNPTVKDPDAGDAGKFKYSLKQGPSGATVDPKTGKISWTPGDSHADKDVTFVLQVCDASNACVTQTWKVKVTNVNDPPKITTQASTKAIQDTTYNYAPKASDPDTNDAGKHVWKLKKGPKSTTFDPKTGKLSWKPGSADAEKNFDFEVEVCDPQNACDKQSWKVQVANVNDPPTITTQAATQATQDKAYTYEPKATDPDTGDAGKHTWKLNKAPKGATIDAKTGKISWTPGSADAEKTFDFEVEVCDPQNACDKQSWKVTVANVNDPPKITTQAGTGATQGQAYSYEPKATDPDTGDAGKHTWKLNKAPKGATIDAKTGKISWTPGSADANKSFDFEVEVCDPQNACDKEAWKVKVANVNDPPSFGGQPSTQATEDKEYSYAPSVSDPDPGDASKLKWTLKKAPKGASLDPKTGKVTWTPGDADAGTTVDFELEVCDPQGACVKQTWQVKVNNVNDTPTFTSTPPTEAFVGKEMTYEPKATDPDPNDTLTWKLAKGPSGATIDPKTGKLSWTPSKADAGKEVEFEVEVCDADNTCVKQTFKVKVKLRCSVDTDCPGTEVCSDEKGLKICMPPGCANQSPACSQQGDICVGTQCVADPCANKTCQAGEVCRSSDGACIKPCQGVSCQAGEYCLDGACVPDPCASSPCKASEYCDASDSQNPTCKPNPCSSNQACRHGRVCAPRKPHCINDPCKFLKCPNPSKQRCVAGQCIERIPCKVDIECPNDEVCLQGLCFPSGCYGSSTSCKAGQLCLRAQCEDPACDSKQCGADEFCRNSDGTCAKACSSVTCKTGEVCRDGACEKDSCAGVKCDAGKICVEGACEAEKCNASNVCKAGRVCNPKANACVDDPCAGVTCPDSKQVCRWGQCQSPPSCSVDKDCPGKQLCLEGKCVQPTCETNSDCASGELCSAGSCKADSCANKTCQDNEFCRAGQCVPSCAGVFCPKGQVCVDGACTQDPCDGVSCSSGEVCVNGKCVNDTCEQDSCKGKRICRAGACTEPPCDNIQCPKGQTCSDGQCKGDLPCKQDSDCPGSGVCINDVCKDSGCYTKPCEGNKLCLSGACVDNPCASKTCGEGEVCRPVDGECVKVCPTCPEGQVCVDGKCVEDPCAGIQCNNEEKCEGGSCKADPCASNKGTCRSQRVCLGGKCSDERCKGMECPSNATCREGVCYGPPVVEEPAVGEEPAVEPTPEPSTDAGEVVEGPDYAGFVLGGGGCACQSTEVMGSFAGVWMFLLGWLVLLRLRRRYHGARKQ